MPPNPSHSHFSWGFTVPVKRKLTVSTRNSILDPRYFRESSLEFRVSSIVFRVSSIEFRVSRCLKNFSRKRLKSRICNNGRNNTALGAASFIRARVHVFHINVQIVSLELKSWIAIIYLPFVAWKTRTSQPNKNVCQREMIFLILSGSSELKFQLGCRMQMYHLLPRL